MRHVGTITLWGESNCYRCAAKVRDEKPVGTEMKLVVSARVKDGWDIMMFAGPGRELVVQKYLTDFDREGENVTGFLNTTLEPLA
jgi:hypothetical protein